MTQDDAKARNRPLQTRVEAAFAGDASSFADTYLDYLVNRQVAAVDSAQRSGILMLIAIALNELLLRAAITEVSFLGFKVADLSFIIIVLPVVAAFQWYEVTAHVLRSAELSVLVRAVVKRSHPALVAEDLWSDVLAPDPPVFGAGLRSAQGAPVSHRVVGTILEVAVAATVQLAPAAYLVWTVFIRKTDIVAAAWLDTSAAIGTAVFLSYGLHLRAIAYYIFPKHSEAEPTE